MLKDAYDKARTLQAIQAKLETKLREVRSELEALKEVTGTLYADWPISSVISHLNLPKQYIILKSFMVVSPEGPQWVYVAAPRKKDGSAATIGHISIYPSQVHNYERYM